MGILSRIFDFGEGSHDTVPQEADWPLDDRAVLRHIAKNDEDPDVRRAAEELLARSFGERLDS